MKYIYINQLLKGYRAHLLCSIILFQLGCESISWKESKQVAEPKDTISQLGINSEIPVVIDPIFNADFDELHTSSINTDEYKRPSLPTLPVLLEEPQKPDTLEFIPIESVQSFPQKDDDLLYIVQRGDTLWGISQNFKISLNKLLRANILTKTSLISIGQELKIPGITESQSPAPTLTFESPTSVFANSDGYIVQKGDNLTRIAYIYGTSIQELKSANGLVSDHLLVGQKLVVPSGGKVRDSYKPALTRTSSTSSNGYHHVSRGEYPSSIARKYGLKTSQLMSMNKISDPSKLQIGTRLVVSNEILPPSVSVQLQDIPIQKSNNLDVTSNLGLDSIGTIPLMENTKNIDIPHLEDDTPIVPVEEVNQSE